jgi:hypothetical protein
MLSSDKKRVFELLQAVTEPFDPPNAALAEVAEKKKRRR